MACGGATLPGRLSAQDPIQALEAMGRQGHLRPDDGKVGLHGGRSEDGDNRYNLS